MFKHGFFNFYIFFIPINTKRKTFTTFFYIKFPRADYTETLHSDSTMMFKQRFILYY